MSLGTGTLKVGGEGPKVIHAPQGGLHDNPASWNHPSSLRLGDQRFPIVGQHGTSEPSQETPSTAKPNNRAIPLSLHDGGDQLETQPPICCTMSGLTMMQSTPTGCRVSPLEGRPLD